MDRRPRSPEGRIPPALPRQRDSFFAWLNPGYSSLETPEIGDIPRTAGTARLRGKPVRKGDTGNFQHPMEKLRYFREFPRGLRRAGPIPALGTFQLKFSL